MTIKELGSDWNIVKFGELVENKDSRCMPLKESDRTERHGVYPYYGASGVIDYVDDYLYEGTHLLIGEDGANIAPSSMNTSTGKSMQW